MTKDEITLLAFQGELEGIRETDVIQYADYTCINGLLPIPVTTIQCSLSSEIDPRVLDENDIYLGTLCLCTKRSSLTFDELTTWQQAAYLVDLETRVSFPSSHNFTTDYLVLNIDKFDNYQADYWKSAPIWGCFTHIEEAETTHKQYSRIIDTIHAQPSLKLPTPYHLDILRSSVLSSHPYDRFLRLYHQLELLFDWVVVREVQLLSENLTGIGPIISRYKYSDIQRLKHLASNFCLDINKLVAIISKLSQYDSVAKQIFFDYGKQGNPIADGKIDQFWELVMTNSLTYETAHEKRIITGIPVYNQLIQDFSVYCIYRVRNSIVHRRIGEYILREEDDEFVIEFAEKLLREVLTQLFSNSTIQDFMT